MKWTTEQLDAINESGKNIIVSAGAGSGKTAVLTERVINKLNNGIKINELLILTFTNLAAHEMKERIKKALIKNNDQENLDLIDSSYITTFDSFSLSIVRKYHYLLNLTPNIKIVDSSIINLKQLEFIDEIFENLYKEKNNKFLKLISDFCVKDDKEIKNYILSINQKLNMKYDKKDYLNDYISKFYSDFNINSLINQYMGIIYNKITFIKDNISEISYLDCEKYYENLLESLDNLINCKEYDDILSNINVKLPTLPKNREDIKFYKENISTTLKELKDIMEYDSFEHLKNTLYMTKEYVEVIIDIIKELDNKTKQYKDEFEQYEFNDIALLAIKLFKTNEDVRIETMNSFKEILIDEYQDTNDIGEEFISLISNNNVYMVGDIKQSIYRFRNANPNLFKSKYSNYKDNISGLKIDLNKNFRSRKEVLNCINLIFETIMDEDIGGANYNDNHAMVFGNNSYTDNNLNNDLEVYTYDPNDYKKEEIEAFIIANDIKNKIKNSYQVCDKTFNLRKVTYSDFTILVDRASNFDLFKKIFEHLELPLEFVRDESITDDVILTVIKNILNLIVKIKTKTYDNEFKYYYMSIARSFLIENTDQEIYNYLNDFNKNELINKIESLTNFEDISIIDLINEIIDKFDIYEKLIKIGNISSRILILDYIKELANNFSCNGSTIYDFIDYLNKISKEDFEIKYKSSMTDSDSVKMMTIHKSKGLEFKICYFPMIYKSFNVSDLKEKFLYDNDYGIIAPYFDLGIGEVITKKLLRDKYIKEEISEKIRLFYVALTRAKEKMIIVSPLLKENKKSKLTYRSFYDMLCSTSLDKFIKNINLDEVYMTKNYNLKKEKNTSFNEDEKIVVTNINIENEINEDKTFSKQTKDLITIDEYNSISLGKYMHYLLEIIDFKNPNYDNIDSFYKNKIVKFLNSDLLKDINECNIYKEYEFMYEEDNTNYHGIIDLIVEHKDYIDIMDYKLKNVEDKNYIKQLNGYKKYIGKISNKKTNIYLYSIIDEIFKTIDNY